MAQTVPDKPQTPDAQMKTAQSDAKASAPAEMKTTMFKGVLVDMSCASQASNTTPPADSAAPASGKASSADRAASDSGSNCPVSSSSSKFGMKLDDGRTVRFDLVGNQRAQDTLKTDKGWNKSLTANQPIHAKVSGVLNGDKLIVSSIH
jgi:hypothetical protein